MPGPATPPQPAELQAELDRLTVLVRQLTASSIVQEMRAGAQGSQAQGMRNELAAMRSSRLWRATWPLRLTLDLVRGAPPGRSPAALLVQQAFATARRDGLTAGLGEVRRYLDKRKPPARPLAAHTAGSETTAASKVMPSPASTLAPAVLIIAELTLPQCAKYRVWQKKEFIEQLGVPCRVVDWRFNEECLSAASLATQVILYRVPGYPAVLHLIERLHALSLPLNWEVDDIIFDAELFLQNRNVDELDDEVRDGVVSGVGLYRSAMLACGAGIASTPRLAQAMRSAGLADVHVVENALDAETLSLAARCRAERVRPRRAGVLIAYGSGTKTHNADFREAAPALLRLLGAHPDASLRVIGELTLPAEFDNLRDRVERLPPVPYARYLQLLAECDINIAPLEPTPFNDAKSNIKFLEAAILGLPSVCSPRAHFTSIVRDGENGVLADDDEAWFAALAGLAGDKAIRDRLGQAALRDTLARYAPEAVARDQVGSLLRRTPDRRRAVQLRVLFANIYYAPRSYGGATLVVEEMSRRLQARGDTDVHVVTGLAPDTPDRAVTRVDRAGVTVFEMPLPGHDVVAEFDNPSMGVAFGEILDAVQPSVVHLHAVQWLSASIAAACIERGIPYVITLHDAWWLCARQFMVMGDGKNCFQTAIDLRICQNCNPGARHLRLRDALLRAALDGAALLLSPSEAHRRLYLANGIAPQRIEVAPNGVRLPDAARAPRQAGPVLRFAYVGGQVEIKGFSVVKRAFEALQRGDWELVLVDNTQNLGFSSVDTADWRVQGTLTIMPAFAQAGLDDFFSGIDVLVFPSQWKESFGLTVREALARDVWVIATDGGGPGEAVINGVNGTLIPLDGRHEPWSRAVTALLDDAARFRNYRNPHAAEIDGYDAQANALHATLTRVAREAKRKVLT